MKRLVLFFVVLRLVCAGNAQQSSSIPYIEQLLMLGEYGKVIDTCQQLVLGGVEDDAIYYRMGLAYQNFLQEELALQFYQKALDLSPSNKAYNYVLAKSYFTAGNYGKAEPLFSRLCSMDTLNWVYAYHLTNIFTQQKRYDEAIAVYKKFWAADSLNYDYLNRIAYATMKKGEHEGAKELFYEHWVWTPKT